MKATAEKSSATTVSATHTAGSPFFAKAGGGDFFAPVSRGASASVQTKLTVNKPGDKHEIEADKMAEKVMRMPASSNSSGKIQRSTQPEEKIQKTAAPEEIIQKKEEDKLQRKGNGVPVAGANVHSSIRSKTNGGQPLPSSVRNFMEPRFNADFSKVRIHSDPESANLSNQLSARAFTFQNHIFFSRDQYQPGSGEGKQLLAHELTHTIQQGHAIQRSPQVSTTASPPAIQRLGIQDALDYFADKAYYIPGFRMLTIILGFNPINMRSTDRNAANILRALIEMVPGGHFITQALDNHGVFSKAGAWVEQQIGILGDIGSDIVSGLRRFLNSLGWRDIFDLGGVWDRAKRIFTDPIGRIISFARNIVTGILRLVKDAILKPLAALAQGTRGYDLLRALLGEDPITGEPVPRNAETLIGGFMKLIGKEEIWENIKKGNAVARAWAWFQGALQGLMGMARSIPRQIMNTLSSFTFQDILTIGGALSKIIGTFAGIASNFMGWAFNQVIGLLEIIFSVVAPGAMPYISKARSAFIRIIQNPIGFVNNLVRAGKLGFQLFATNIVTHLKTALIKWITGPLGDAGVYIPKSFSLMEIIKLVLSVLGLTWQNIRSKLVKIIPEPVLAGLEKTAGILVTLVKDGPAAAWEQIKTELAELKDQLIEKITEMVSGEIVKAAVQKLAMMLNPAGAVIQAIIAIYNTISFFIEKINQIAAVVGSFINSIAAIAAGQVMGAAKKVEQTMANTLVVIIGFLAKFAGLGNIPKKLVDIVKKIRKPIDKGLDKIVAWLGRMLKKAREAVFNWAFSKTTFKEANGKSHSIYVEGNETPHLMIASDPKSAEEFLKWYLKEKGDVFAEKKSELIKKIQSQIKEANQIAEDINGMKKNNKAWETRQQDMLKKNVELSGSFSKLVGDDRSIGDAIEKYKLEGMTGTYGSIPKPTGDDLTADHQPQAAILIAAANFSFFEKNGEMNERAAKRAHQGYAINLQKTRHIAGATYGYKGKQTKESFLMSIKPSVIDKPPKEQRKVVIKFLKSELKRDATAIKSVVKAQHDSPVWKDVMDKVGDEKAGKKLILEIRGRIMAGEDQIVNQDLDSLAN